MMKINVLHNFGGSITHELRILPGVYDATDDRLFGIADHLVSNGHAEVIEADEPAPVVEAVDVPVEPEQVAVTDDAQVEVTNEPAPVIRASKRKQG